MSELPRSVLLVATDDLNWDVLRATLAELPEVRVTGDVQRADEARRAIERPPDLIIAAAALDDSSSVPLLAELKTRSPRSRLLVLGHQAEPDDLQRLSEIGMAGYLVWSDLNATTFHHCLAAVIGGAVTVVSRTAARAPFDAWSRGRGVSSSVEVSERERRVLGHLANGCTREQAAAAERVSVRTIERIIADLEVRLEAPTPFVLGMKAAQIIRDTSLPDVTRMQ